MDFSAKILNDSAPYALDEELVYVRKLADKVKTNEHILMLGAGPGVFALAMLEGRNHPPHLTVVDYEFGSWFDAHLLGIGADISRVDKIQSDTATLGGGWEGPAFALIVVDADHSYMGVCRDIAAWWNHLKPGGWMVFHDYLERTDGFNGVGAWQKGGTAEALNDCLPEEIHNAQAFGISMALQKKPLQSKTSKGPVNRVSRKTKK